MRIKINNKSEWADIEQDIQENFSKNPDDTAITIRFSGDKTGNNIGALIKNIILKTFELGEIVTLRIENITLDENLLNNIQNALASENSLAGIHLGEDDINDAGALIIGNILKNNHSIKELELTGNNITETGLGYIANALENNKTLEQIYLSINPIKSINGITQLVNSGVQGIDLECCDIKSINNEVLEYFVKSMLNTIDLSNNAINLSELAPTLGSFCKNGLKTEIDLRNQNDGSATTLNQKLGDHSCPPDAYAILKEYSNIEISGVAGE
jgi:hypothetical protein